jgi:hypothetical protein
LAALPPQARTALTTSLVVCGLSVALTAIVGVTYSYSARSFALSGAAVVALLATALFIWILGPRMLAPESSPSRPALGAGLFIGVLWTVEIAINNLVAPGLPSRDLIDNACWAVVALGIAAVAAGASRRSGRLSDGFWAGLGAGLGSGLVACVSAQAMIVLGMRFILADPLNVAEWAARGPASGAPGMAAYFAFESLAGALMHLLVLGVAMGVLLGVIGGAVGRLTAHTAT